MRREDLKALAPGVLIAVIIVAGGLLLRRPERPSPPDIVYSRDEVNRVVEQVTEELKHKKDPRETLYGTWWVQEVKARLAASRLEGR